MPRKQSSWYHHDYLAAKKRNAIHLSELIQTHLHKIRNLTLNSRVLFRVYWSVFIEIKELTIDRKYHDPNKKDAVGFAHDVELLLLGMLYYLGWDTTFAFVSTNTEIDQEVHRTFHN